MLPFIIGKHLEQSSFVYYRKASCSKFFRLLLESIFLIVLPFTIGKHLAQSSSIYYWQTPFSKYIGYHGGKL